MASIRRQALVKIKDVIHGLIVNGRTLTAENRSFDPLERRTTMPIASVIPLVPSNVRVSPMSGLLDQTLDIGIILADVVGDETLFLDAEDWVEGIVNELVKQVNLDAYCTIGFGLTGIGPIVAAEDSDQNNFLYIMISVQVQIGGM